MANMEEAKQYEVAPWQVAECLRMYPDFFTSYPEVIEALDLHHSCGAATSLIEQQVQQLRSKNKQLQAQLDQFVATAHQNDQINQKVYALVLQIMQHTGSDSLDEQVVEYMTNHFGADFCTLRPMADFSDKFVQSLAEKSSADNVYQGRLNHFCEAELFGDNAQQIQSVACVQLPLSTPKLLVLGSTSSGRYQENAGSWFLQQIARVLTVALDG